MSRLNDQYTRATGRHSKASTGIYSDSRVVNKTASTIYTIEDEDAIVQQHPIGQLTNTQSNLIYSFLSGICSRSDVIVDPIEKELHKVGEWKLRTPKCTISAFVVQPNVANATVHISRPPTNQVKQDYHEFDSCMNKRPYTSYSMYNVQVQGSMAIPFVDYMIFKGTIDPKSVSWSNVVLSRTQIIFIVVTNTVAKECCLTSRSCEILERYKPAQCAVMPPKSNSESFTFRKESLIKSEGSGPTITIHKSGTMQYQGSGNHVEEVASNLRACLDHVILSTHFVEFLASLGEVRDQSHILAKV